MILLMAVSVKLLQALANTNPPPPFPRMLLSKAVTWKSLKLPREQYSALPALPEIVLLLRTRLQLPEEVLLGVRNIAEPREAWDPVPLLVRVLSVRDKNEGASFRITRTAPQVFPLMVL